MMKSKILVFIQFFVIFLMLLPLGEETCLFDVGVLFLILGGGVGVMALMQNRLGNFNIRPDIKASCELVTSGIYGLIRHPMYLSVLLMMSAFLWWYPSSYEFVLFGILFINLVVKLRYEEYLWCCDSEDYRKYMQKTKRLIPFVW